MKRTARRVAAFAGRLLAPPACVLCGRPLADGRLCDGCLADLPWNLDACPRCAEPDTAAPAAGCAHCQADPPPWTRAVAPLVYAFPVDAALKALKFRQCLYHAPAFASLLLPHLLELEAVDALVPVPLHRWRQLRRGYNQAVELCRPLARHTGLPVVRSVRRVRATAPQPGLDRAARRRNLAGAFHLSSPPTFRHAVIVDDVMTTGETCRQLTRTLLAGRADRVSILTVARAATPRR